MGCPVSNFWQAREIVGLAQQSKRLGRTVHIYSYSYGPPKARVLLHNRYCNCASTVIWYNYSNVALYPVADLRAVRGVQMHLPFAASNVF